MKKYDFFISYSSCDSPIVKSIVEELEKKGAKCWIAPRDIDGGIPYAKAIVNAIKESKVFLLCLSRNAALSDQVLNEIEVAYKRIGSEDRILLQPLFIEDFSIDDEEYDALTYYIKRFNYIVPKRNNDVNDIVNEIVCNNNDIFAVSHRASNTKIESSYFVDENEAKRLELQSQIGLKFDKDLYLKIFNKYSAPIILDLGCGDGNQLCSRLGGIENYQIVGIEYDENQLKRAQSNHSKENAHYYLLDVESNDFVTQLREIMEMNHIDSFDIINIALLLKHLKNPSRLLYKLRKFLNSNGTIIIREYESCVEYAYPDPHNHFERLFDIYRRDEFAGYSHTGREVYHMLYEAGYTKVQIERLGCPTIGYTPEEKEVEFNVSLAYLKEDLRLLVEKYPNDQKYRDDYEWYLENEEEFLEEFLRPGFVYMAGRILYSAQK